MGLNKGYTVGKLEEILRNYSKDTVIHSSFGNCHHSTNGDIEIIDKTGQTYGYIEINVNNRHDPKIECAADGKEFYEREIERLKRELRNAESKVGSYDSLISQVKVNIERSEYYIKRD